MLIKENNINEKRAYNKSMMENYESCIIEMKEAINEIKKESVEKNKVNALEIEELDKKHSI